MRGHECVVVKRCVVRCARTAHVDVAPVGDIHLGTVHAEETGFTDGCIVRNGFTERNALHVLRTVDVEELEQRCRQVDGLHERLTSFATFFRTGIPYKQRRMRDLVVEWHRALRPPAMLAEKESVVGVDDEHRVVPHIQLIHEIEHATEVVVAHAVKRCTFVAHVFDFFRGFINLLILRPIEVLPLVCVRVEFLVFLVGEKWFVWIECLNMQEPVVIVGVTPHEVESAGHGLVLRRVLRRSHERAIDPVLPPESIRSSSDRFWDFRVANLPDPRFTFLPTGSFPRRVFRVVGSAALFPVVVVITHEVGIDAVLLHE